VPEQQKLTEIEAINQQIAALKEQAYTANAETKTYAEDRDKLNEQFRKLRQEIYALTGERNSLNEKVKALKQQRDEARTKIRSSIEEIKAIRQKIAELKKKMPRQSYQELQREFADIEWKIQTTSLGLQEEKELIETVKQVETQLKVYKKIEQQNQQITELQRELDALKTKADGFHQELADAAQKSQEIHTKIIAKIAESKQIKNEADGLHSAYLQEREKTAPLRSEIKKLMEQRAKLQSAVREEDERNKKTAEQALKEQLGSQAKEKLRRGEKLSWDEFQLLSEDDDQTQD
jgi:uncharacterized coiled-coil DUF342 family protein